MQVLIQNYATSRSTEPLYISETLGHVGVNCVIWNKPDVTAFDMFDACKPSLFITNYRLITNDIIKYLAINPGIDCVVNITGATQEHIETMESVFENNRVSCPFMFTNRPRSLCELSPKSIPLHSIMHGADCYLPKQGIQTPDFEIDLGVIVDSPNDKVQSLLNKPTYHIISHDEEFEGVDIVAPIMHMYPLYSKYKQCVIETDNYVPQSFFDSMFFGNETRLVSSSNLNEAFEKNLKLPLSLLSGEKINPDKIKEEAINNHTCISRVARMLSKLDCSTLSKKVESLVGDLK